MSYHAEADYRANHAYAHRDSQLEHWQEEDCSICEAEIENEIEAGIRCKHGELIPNVPDIYGTIGTDLECPECAEIELDKSVDRDIDFQKHGI